MARADFIRPGLRRPRPAGNPAAFSFSQERSPLQERVLQGVTSGQINGTMPSTRVPAPPQPALVISDSIEKSLNLMKAIRAHADCLHKAGTQGGLTPSGNQGFSMHVKEDKPIDVSTPQHEHARLQAKQMYLQDKMKEHKAMGRGPDHPETQRHASALSSTTSALQNMEKQGIKSTEQHHDDWISHHAKSDHSFAPTAMNAHLQQSRLVSAESDRKNPTPTSAKGPEGKERAQFYRQGAKHIAAQGKPERDASLAGSPGLVAAPGADTASQRAAFKPTQGTAATKVSSPGAVKPTSTVHTGAEKVSSPAATEKTAKLPATQVQGTPTTATSVTKIEPSSLPKTTAQRSPQGGQMAFNFARSMLDGMMHKAAGKKGDDWISDKISLLVREGKPQKQAVAIAYSMAGRTKKSDPGLYVSN